MSRNAAAEWEMRLFLRNINGDGKPNFQDVFEKYIPAAC